MDTEHLRLFVLAAERMNITAAGRALDLSPAVASARLARLEKALGVDLLHRSTRRMSLSAAGERLLPYAREILSQADAARGALESKEGAPRGTLRVTASSSFCQRYIAPLLPEFLDLYPEVRLDLQLSDGPVNLVAGGFDLALRNYPIEESGLRARKIAEDTRILCAAPEYLKRYGTPAVPDDLVHHRLLAFGAQGPRTLRGPDGDSASLFPPRGSEPSVVCDDGTSMRIATRAGVGISMNSLWSVHDDLASGALVRVLPDHVIDDAAAIWFVYPMATSQAAKVRVFIDFVIERIGAPPVWAR